MNFVPTDSPATLKPPPASGRPTGPAISALLTPQEARLVAAILGLLLLGLAIRFIHLRGKSAAPIPAAPASSRLIRSPTR